MSRRTWSPVSTRLSARVVGTPRWCIASLQRNSRIDERSTARPSARREYGVGPAPLSCSSHRWPDAFSTSPSVIARPSPSCPAQCAELMAAVVRRVRLHSLEQRRCRRTRSAKSGDATSSGVKPDERGDFAANRRSAAARRPASAARANMPRRRPAASAAPCSGSPGSSRTNALSKRSAEIGFGHSRAASAAALQRVELGFGPRPGASRGRALALP